MSWIGYLRHNHGVQKKKFGVFEHKKKELCSMDNDFTEKKQEIRNNKKQSKLSPDK